MNELNLMSLEEMREHEWYVPWSGGKDSTATILLMLEYGIPIRQVNHVRMMWDDEIPATLPVMKEFVDDAAKRLEQYGCRVVIKPCRRTAVDLIEATFVRSRRGLNGCKYGVSGFMRGHCKLSGLKEDRSKRISDGEFTMLGYASDEHKRLRRLNSKIQSILASLGVVEEETYDIVREANMLSPLYSIPCMTRDGCWFCPNSNKGQREFMRLHYKDLVEKIEWAIEQTEIPLQGLVNRNNWLKDYAKAHPDDWRWRDCLAIRPKGWIPGQMVMEEMEIK